MSALRVSQSRQWRVSIDMVVANVKPASGGKRDEPRSNFRKQGLASLVMTHIALSAADALGKHLLRHAKTFTNGFQVVHPVDSSGASVSGQYRR